MSENQKTHFLLLDAMRGMAAISVFIYHLKEFVFQDTVLGQTDYFLKSYLAVDLFFFNERAGHCPFL